MLFFKFNTKRLSPKGSDPLEVRQELSTFRFLFGEGLPPFRIVCKFFHPEILRKSVTQPTVLLLFGFVQILWWPLICPAQEELLTDLPERLGVYGTISDEQGQGIPGAEVALVFGRQQAIDMHSLVLFPPACFTTRTDEDGRYAIELDLDDPQASSSSRWKKETLLIQADGYTTGVYEVDLTRMMIRFPFDVQLQRGSSLELQILDAAGNPIVDAQVKPAIIGDISIPLQIAWNTSAVTGVDGRVSLAGMSARLLQAVYIESEHSGGHQARVRLEGGEAIASLLPTGRVSARIELDEGIDISEIQGTKIFIMTLGEILQGRKVLERSWQIVELEDGVEFSCDHLMAGFVMVYPVDDDWPFFTPHFLENLLTIDDRGMGSPDLGIKISRLRIEPIKVVDESGQPLAGIFVTAGEGGGLGVTDEQGIYQHRFPASGSLSGQIFPSDPLGRYQIVDPFGLSLDRWTQQVEETRSITMARSRSLRGVIVDENGHRVPGATIIYSYPSERFFSEEETVADESGGFEIRGLPPATAIEIKARFENLASDPNDTITIESGDSSEIVLQLVPQATARPTGRLVDSMGAPVSGATVSIEKGVISEPEGFSGQHLSAIPVASDLPGVTTDDDGYFQFPDILDYDQRLRLVIEKEGYLTQTTPFISAGLRTVTEGQIDLGVATIHSLPQRITTSITILDHVTGQPIPNVELAFVGIFSGRQNGTTDQEGKVVISLFDTPQLVAARSPNYQILFQYLDRIDKTLQLELAPNDTLDSPSKLAWPSQNTETYLISSRRLLDQLDVPTPVETTFYRQSLYFSALAGLDAAEMLDTLDNSEPTYEYRDYHLQYHLTQMFQLDFEKTVQLIRDSDWAAAAKANFFSLAASMTTDEAIKLDLYGEAALFVSELSGYEYVSTGGRLAANLILDGQIESAQVLLADIWSKATDLQDILSANETKVMLGEARTFAPVFSVVDLETSLKLVRLIALEPEKESGLTEALIYHAVANDLNLEELARQQGIKIARYGFSKFLREGTLRSKGFADWLGRNLDAIPDSAEKVQAAVLAARYRPPGTERSELLAVAAEARNRCAISYYFDDPLTGALLEILQSDSWQTGELDELLFVSLQHAPTSFLNRSMIDIYGNYARFLSLIDPRLARQFLQTAIDTDSWHYGHEFGSRFNRNELLNSAAWIDPNYAAEVAESIAQRWEAEDPLNRLEVLANMIKSLNKVRLKFE